ncbi:MAG: hypothetical protein JETT_0393 [Candidatus Jettenia ecosi]|uniref:Uncharacterized protein n=1 Tax=Candidatus Jettenia ecosi TaxID=2494326 RepID=A0A533QEY3_9BACT|nr:MAG: hypothetical protein JETT_0393 [Candidatus Jettenia ecosi]
MYVTALAYISRDKQHAMPEGIDSMKIFGFFVKSFGIIIDADSKGQ